MFASDIHRGFELVVMEVGLSAIVLWRFLMRHGWVNAASGGMLFFFLLSISMILYSGGTIRSAGVVYYPALVVMATLLISRRAGIVAFILTSIVGIALVQGEISGRLPTPQNEISFASTTIIVSGLGLILVLLYLATKSTDDALKQARDKTPHITTFDIRATRSRPYQSAGYLNGSQPPPFQHPQSKRTGDRGGRAGQGSFWVLPCPYLLI